MNVRVNCHRYGAEFQRKTEYNLLFDRIQRETLGLQGDKNTWYLQFLAVRPEYQGKGVGKALVQFVTDIVLLFDVVVDRRPIGTGPDAFYIPPNVNRTWRFTSDSASTWEEAEN